MYVKLEIKQVTLPNNITLGIGVICDTEYKLEIRVSQFDSAQKFEVGENVEIVGRINVGNTGPYIMVSNMNDIKKTNKSKKSWQELFRATKISKQINSGFDGNVNKVSYILKIIN